MILTQGADKSLEVRLNIRDFFDFLIKHNHNSGDLGYDLGEFADAHFSSDYGGTDVGDKFLILSIEDATLEGETIVIPATEGIIR